jgi:hypothetical protein
VPGRDRLDQDLRPRQEHEETASRSDRADGVEDPQAYLADALTRLIHRHPASQIDQLMPWAYAQRQPVS